MLVNKKYNDQNINRVCTKMSEHFTGQKSNTKLSNTSENVAYFQDINSEIVDNLNLSYDHIYATNENKNGVINPDENCQNAESEVRFLKEWLLIHLDLIQQQNDDILSKENTIFFLQQENEMLKERIRCMEIGTPFQSGSYNNHKTLDFINKSFSEDMTQDSGPDEEDNNDKTLDLEDLRRNCDIELLNYDANHEDERCEKIANENQVSSSNPHALDAAVSEEVSSSDTINYNSVSVSEDPVIYNNIKYNINNIEDSVAELDSMKNLRMSIRRKRLCSNSSAFSNNENSTEEKQNCSRIRKKRKRCVKDDEVLSFEDLYHTQAGEVSLIPPTEQEIAAEAASVTTNNLEVPHWRVKVYASCYTMEGTENLEDAVYNRRHSRLEIDERRRKRWDVQRIREQRIIEKLKLRQERGARAGEPEPVQSLWPTLEDVKFIELCAQLPVSSLGSPLVKFSRGEFSLPWMSNPPLAIKKTKRLRRRRKGTKR